MADNERRDAGEGRLPLSSFDKYTTLDLEGLSEQALFQIITDTLEKLPITRFAELRTLMENKRTKHLEEARAALLNRFREQAAEYGLQLEDVFPQTGRRRPRIDAGQSVRPKYRDPETGETWAGRGMEARFIREAKERGEDIEKYRIPDEEE